MIDGNIGCQNGLVFTIRPGAGGTALWIPSALAEVIGVKRGDTLTPEQFNHPQLKQRLQDIRASEGPRRQTET